jgi:hypothetical protein
MAVSMPRKLISPGGNILVQHSMRSLIFMYEKERLSQRDIPCNTPDAQYDYFNTKYLYVKLLLDKV